MDRGGAIRTQAANSMTARTKHTIRPSPRPMPPIVRRVSAVGLASAPLVREASSTVGACSVGVLRRCLCAGEKGTRNDAIIGPGQANRALDPRAEQRGPTSFDLSERVAAPGKKRALADHNEPRLGPAVEPFGVGGLAAMVRSQKNIRGRPRGRTADQLIKSEQLEISGQEQMASAEGDVEHKTSRVVRGFRVPAGGRMPNREPTPASSQVSGAVVVRTAIRRTVSCSMSWLAMGLSRPANCGGSLTSPIGNRSSRSGRPS